MNKVLLLIAIVFGLFSALVFGGYSLFGVWGGLGGLVLFVVAMKMAVALVKNRFVQLGKALFDSKSRVLRGATVKLHGVTNAPPVKPEHDDDGESEPENHPTVPTQFYFVDVTIVPPARDGSTPFAGWDCDDLRLVPFDAKAPDMNADEPDDAEGPECRIHDVAWIEDGSPGEDSSGEQRLKLLVEVPQGMTRLKFQYYFEMFGDVAVPR